jgi:hypothetical protein
MSTVPTVPTVPDQTARLADMRHRGVRGTIIAPHRSMLGLDAGPKRLVLSLVGGFAGTAALLAALPAIGRLWIGMVEALHGFLGLPGSVEQRQVDFLRLVQYNLPVLSLEAPVPDHRTLWIAAIASVGLGAVTLLLRGRALPLAYFLRMTALLLLITAGYFALAGDRFPYRLPEYGVGLLTGGVIVMGLIPLILGLTYYVFDLSFFRKVFVTVAVVGHLAVFLPLQAMVHVYLVANLSLVVMPVLFLLFGLMLDVMIFVAFYGWAMSGPTPTLDRAAG